VNGTLGVNGVPALKVAVEVYKPVDELVVEVFAVVVRFKDKFVKL